MTRGSARDAGQSTVEVVGLLPLLALAGIAVLQLLAAGVAAEMAGHAAESGAIALADGRDARDAARKSLPGWSRRRVAVSVDGRAVRVRVRPPTIVPGVATLLAAEVEADAGPRPR